MLHLDNLPPDFINFLLVTLFALLIGLEQRRHHDLEKTKFLFGTDRTFAFIGILGFVLYLLDKERLFFLPQVGCWFLCSWALPMPGASGGKTSSA